MNNKIVTVKSPGKIYIAGEYAVVLGGGSIIFPVNKFVRVKVSEAEDYYLFSHKYHKDFIRLDLDQSFESTKYIVEVIKWFRKYLKELNRKEDNLKIEIDSSLDNNDNQKYGFGSSGAIIIAVIKALFVYYEIPFDNLSLYKAAVMVQSNISRNTSYGDLACISFEEKIYYKMFNESIFELLDNNTIHEGLKTDWDGLEIQKLDLKLNFLIVHTNKTANSFELVKNVMKYKNSSEFLEFFNKSNELIFSLKNSNFTKDIIRELDENLKYLNMFSNSNLFTPEMDIITSIVTKYNGISKFSGAGGGDSVLCFFESFTNQNDAKEELIKNGFNLLIYPFKGSDYYESKR